MSAQLARFIRYVLPHEAMADLVQQAKHLTWEYYCEVALLQLENGRRVLVRGGRFGIELERIGNKDPLGRKENDQYLEIEGQPMRVIHLVFHTDPLPSGGPSDDDLNVLALLGQQRSVLYELFGPREGTEIRPKRR